MMIEVAALTDIGLRRSFNEDAVLVLGNYEVFAVIDGMGGVSSGMEAARLAAVGIAAFFQAPGVRLSPFLTPLLAQAIQQANRDIRIASTTELVLRGMGAAIAAIQVAGEFVSIAHVGDCRAYRYSKSKLELLTDDHSLMQEMLRTGHLTVEQAKDFPHKNVITRALGAADTVQVECKSVIPEHGDVFLLSSDGLHGMLDDLAIEALLSRESAGSSNLDHVARTLVDAANAAGGSDNIAVVLVRTTQTRLKGRAR